jgi:endogenous inhibitor of DNA gyrase (YacG/DUF329 family)
MPPTRSPKCPICRKPAERTAENPWFPFCSNRCKVVDLSKWLNEEYRVPSQEEDEGDATRPGEDDGGHGLH